MGPRSGFRKVDFVAAYAHESRMIEFAINFPPLHPEIFAFDVFGFHVALRWYALAYIAAFIIALPTINAMLRRPALWKNSVTPLHKEDLEDLLVWIIFGVILGGRFGYVIFYQPGYYWENPAEIMQVWNGGMSFHGGALGVIVAAAIYCYRNGKPMLGVGDLIALATPTGLLLGRIANFINAELWGRPTDAPWGVIFPGQAAQNCPGVEGLCARHPSQLYEAGLEGLLLGTVMLWLAFRMGALKTPGVLIGVFIAGYGIGRSIVEFFRQPDAQFVSEGNPIGYAMEFFGTGITRGQQLSIPMIVIGLAIIVIAKKRAARTTR